MFRGITAIQMDEKGRVAMPRRYRERLQRADVSESTDELVVTIDTEESCLLVYPLPEWEIIERKLEALPSFNPAARRVQRLLMGHATEVRIDAQGRLLVPPLLRDYAKLEKSVMLVGQGKKFEMWSEAGWASRRDSWLEAHNEDQAEMPDELKSLSL